MECQVYGKISKKRAGFSGKHHFSAFFNKEKSPIKCTGLSRINPL
jgi:hypothetical protein